ncbi:MAG TPA: DUF6529 family protein [Pseudonocardiaceae bacterium]
MVHCLYALGFQSYPVLVLIHSLLGCLFFGAFTAKMLLLTRRGLPGWAIPLIGGVVFPPSSACGSPHRCGSSPPSACDIGMTPEPHHEGVTHDRRDPT